MEGSWRGRKVRRRSLCLQSEYLHTLSNRQTVISRHVTTPAQLHKNMNICDYSCDCTSCRTLLAQRDLGVVGSEAGEVLLLAGDQSQQHDVSRGQEGQRVMGVSTLSEEGPHKHGAAFTLIRSSQTSQTFLSASVIQHQSAAAA